MTATAGGRLLDPRAFGRVERDSLDGLLDGIRAAHGPPWRKGHALAMAAAIAAANASRRVQRGPSGRSNASQAANSTIHATRNASEYGSIVAISVPMPAFGSWRWKKAMISAK